MPETITTLAATWAAWDDKPAARERVIDREQAIVVAANELGRSTLWVTREIAQGRRNGLCALDAVKGINA